MKPLYEIADNILALLETDDNGELAVGVEESLDGLQMAFEDKVEACCKVYRDYEAEAKALSDEAARFSKRAQAAANARDRIKAYLKNNLEKLGIAKMDAGMFNLRLQANGQPSVKVSVAAIMLPPRFTKVVVEPYNAELVKAWKDGEKLPDGVEVVKGNHVRIS